MRGKQTVHRKVDKQEVRDAILSSPHLVELKQQIQHMKEMIKKLKTKNDLMDGMKSLNHMEYLYFKELARLEKGNAIMT